MECKIHEILKPISWISGHWVTKEGKGCYPNIPDFEYHEELEFICIGQPMFNFLSTSRHPEKQTPMHQERGFLRIKPGTNKLAFVVSHNFGLTSLEEGSCDVDKKEIVLETVNLSRISFAKAPYVKNIKRVIKLLAHDILEVTLYMETDRTPLTEHLKAIYKKVNEVPTHQYTVYSVTLEFDLREFGCCRVVYETNENQKEFLSKIFNSTKIIIRTAFRFVLALLFAITCGPLKNTIFWFTDRISSYFTLYKRPT